MSWNTIESDPGGGMKGMALAAYLGDADAHTVSQLAGYGALSFFPQLEPGDYALVAGRVGGSGMAFVVPGFPWMEMDKKEMIVQINQVTSAIEELGTGPLMIGLIYHASDAENKLIFAFSAEDVRVLAQSVNWTEDPGALKEMNEKGIKAITTDKQSPYRGYIEALQELGV